MLQLLKDLKAPLSAFQYILNWVAKAHGSGHVFQVHCQPSRKTVTKAQECNGRECRGVGVRRAGLLGLGAWRAGVAAPDAAGAGVAAPEAGKGKARSVVPAGD